MKYICITIVALFLSAFNNVSAAIVFTKVNSPYHLSEDFIVDEGDTLIIEQGVKVIIDEDINIRIMGVLLVNGAYDDPVFFNPSTDTIGWGIIDINSPGSSCIITNAYITDGRIVTHDVNLSIHNVDFINRQSLSWNSAIVRVLGGAVSITRCRVVGSGLGEGFLIHDIDNAVVTKCSFINIPDAVEFINVNDGMIRRNVFSDLPDDAIDLNNCSNIVIDSNTIINAEDRGMEIGSENFGSSENIMVNRNLIIGCNEGIVFKENSYGSLSNNTFYKNNIAVSSIETQSAITGSIVVVRNSVFSQSVDADFYFDEASTIDVNYSLSDMALPDGINNLFGNPLFVDSEENDFTLMHDSPCIDTGDPQSQFDPDNTISDMGAFYYNSDTSFISESELLSITAYPNPFREKLYITYQLVGENTISVTLYDIRGVIIYSTINKLHSPGNHTIKINLCEIKYSGPVVCKFSIGDKSNEFVLLKQQ